MKKMIEWFLEGSVEKEIILWLPAIGYIRILIKCKRPRLFWIAMFLIIVAFEVLIISLDWQ
jgi:hypothetical protein